MSEKEHKKYHKATKTPHLKDEQPMIKRSAYDRKGYTRSAYTRTDGTHVKATYVKPTHVKASYIPSQVDKWTKGKKIINLQDSRHLGEFGYTFSASKEDRHKALDEAVKKYGKTWAIRRLNAIGNISRNSRPGTFKKTKVDIEYLKSL